MSLVSRHVTGLRTLSVLAALALAGTLAWLPADASAASSCDPDIERCEAELDVKIKGSGKAKRGTLRQTEVGNKVRLVGTLRPYVPGQKVTVRLKLGKKTAFRKTVKVKPSKSGNIGKFNVLSKPLVTGGPYRATAVHLATPQQDRAKDRTPKLRINVPAIGPNSSRAQILLLQRWLKRLGYYVPRNGKWDGGTQRAVLAFRKTNRMARTTNASVDVTRMLAAGQGGYKVRFPQNGRHVEADLSRQIMVLVDKGKAQHIFHISSGAPVTPTLRGNFRFYRYEPGYNNLGMYYSVYYDRGYAIHGYKSVPTYPASHGCLRNPTANSIFIYNWVKIGMQINIY